MLEGGLLGVPVVLCSVCIGLAVVCAAGAGTAPLNSAILVEFCLVNDEQNMLFGGCFAWFQRGFGGVGEG